MSQKINCLIVDDEPLAQQVIETYIQKMPSLVLVGKCDNAMEAKYYTTKKLMSCF